MVAYCNATCQLADRRAHKLVCNKDVDLRRATNAGGSDENVVDAPSPWVSHQMVLMLELEPAVMEELAEPSCIRKSMSMRASG